MRHLKQWWQLHRMGYQSNQMGIMRRHLRQKGTWDNHLERTKRTIMEEVERRKPQTIMVIGSGWLLDVPIKGMLESGANIQLVDLAHPTKIKHKFSSNENISIINYDATGGGMEAALSYRVFQNGKSYRELINRLRHPEHTLQPDADLIISVNLLSQLHFPITDYLYEKKRIGISQVAEIAEAIQTAHINYLPKGRSLLITDYEEELTDDEGTLIGVQPRLQVDLNKLGIRDGWQWEFDTYGTYTNSANCVLLNVAAVLV